MARCEPMKTREIVAEKRLGEARFRVSGCRTTVERLKEVEERSEWLDLTRPLQRVFLLRQRKKELELGTDLHFGGKALQAGRVTPDLPKTHYKTIVSLDMDLHAWQQNLRENQLRQEIRQRQAASQGPTATRSVILKPTLSLMESIRNMPVSASLVLSQEQKRQLSQEVVRSAGLRSERNSQVVPLRPHIGLGPTTYRVRTHSWAVS